MDARTDAGVEEEFRTVLSRAGGENRTLIAVTHWLQVVIDYDMVVAMRSGTILELGRLKELFDKKSSVYDMVMQSGEKHLWVL